MNVSHMIKPHVEQTPQKTAIIFGEREISYAQLDDLVARTAHGVTKMGYKKGDVLSIFLPSLPELVIAYLGAVRAGVTVNESTALHPRPNPIRNTASPTSSVMVRSIWIISAVL